MMVKGDKLYKPSQGASSIGGDAAESRGAVEANFYKTVNDQKHPLADFLPKYYGVETEDGTDYLVMENSVHGFVRPCVMDLKMGTQTYGEDATPEKIAREEKKYPPQKTLGFRFVGMKVWQPASESFTKTEREWCMAIDETTVGDGLKRFFDNGTGTIRTDVVLEVREQIGAIKATLESHPFMRLYGSSLLVIYEGDLAAPKRKAVVKMIDFAHPFPITDGGVDAGYIKGCDTILTKLAEI